MNNSFHYIKYMHVPVRFLSDHMLHGRHANIFKFIAILWVLIQDKIADKTKDANGVFHHLLNSSYRSVIHKHMPMIKTSVPDRIIKYSGLIKKTFQQIIPTLYFFSFDLTKQELNKYGDRQIAMAKNGKKSRYLANFVYRKWYNHRIAYEAIVEMVIRVQPPGIKTIALITGIVICFYKEKMIKPNCIT